MTQRPIDKVVQFFSLLAEGKTVTWGYQLTEYRLASSGYIEFRYINPEESQIPGNPWRQQPILDFCNEWFNRSEIVVIDCHSLVQSPSE